MSAAASADPAALRDLPAPALPWLVRRFNAGGSAASAREQLDADELIAVARRRLGTQSAPFGPRVHEGLSRLCRSVKDEAVLSRFGALYAKNMLVTSLVVRARVDAWIDAHPDLDDTPLVPPLIVVGLQRSGTTHLHRLLCAAEDARPVPLWELMMPAPPARGLDLRRLQVRLAFGAFRRTSSPVIDAMHYMRPDLPDECQFLLRLDFRAPVLWTALSALSYCDWLLEEDLNETYQLYRRVLLLLQRGSPGKRLTLKNPGHALHLRELLGAVPEALVVQTHRDPLHTLASQCKLTLTAQSGLTEGVDVARVIDRVVEMQRVMAERSVQARAGSCPILDVDYRSLVADPQATVRRIRAHFDLSPPDEARLGAYAGGNRQYSRGSYRYAPDQFGLDADRIAALFQPYVARFLSDAAPTGGVHARS